LSGLRRRSAGTGPGLEILRPGKPYRGTTVNFISLNYTYSQGLKQIVAASAGQQPKVRRHSTETKITIEEMQQNERRSREAKEKRK